MPSSLNIHPLDPAVVKAMLGDGRELALIDLREELIFSRNHLLWARSIPLSRLELRFARLVPRRATRIVLCDDNDGLVERAAAILSAAGYTDVSSLQGGVAAWGEAPVSSNCFLSALNVPSKAFGEHIEHTCHTPNIGPEELDALMKSGTDMVVVDSRPFDEFQRVSIPTATNVPGAELVLRVRDIAPSPDTLVVVNCAGRTRSIIGAQSLINAGLPNKVVALRNGTMGYIASRSLKPDSGKTKRYGEPSEQTRLAWARDAADRVAKKFGVMRIDAPALESFRADTSRTLYVFDVRDPTEYRAGHFPGALNAPGGQLVQATDQYAGTLGARIVVLDDREVRALMTASWLKQMGWRDVFVLAAGGSEIEPPPLDLLGRAPSPDRLIELAALSELVAKDRVTVVDLSLSPAYRKGHIPGAWYAIRTRLSQRTIQDSDERRIDSDVGRRRAGRPHRGENRERPRVRCAGGNCCLAGSGASTMSAEPRMADEPLDYWPKPYERTGNTKDAMNEYLSWEVDLLPRIARDGTTRFVQPALATRPRATPFQTPCEIP